MLESKKKELPRTIEQLMAIYSEYEKDKKTEDYTVDYLQYSTFKSNPITPFHKDYYKTKYKTKFFRLSYLFLILSIAFYILYFGGFIIEAYIFKIGIENELISRLIVFAFPTGYVIFLTVGYTKYFNKWNWVSYAIISAIIIAILFSAIATIRVFTGEEETFFDIIYTVSGLSLGPACLIFFLIYKFHCYITDYGGIHLFFGWIYRISETHGDLKSLHLSFEKLMLDLDSWLNHTLKLIIKNRIEILEGFSLNIISDENFIDNISKDNKFEFENTLNGLLVDDILFSDTFSDVKSEFKEIKSLDKFNLKYLNYRVAMNQLPKITKLIEKLSSKKLEVSFYSASKKFSKYKSKIIPSAIFIIGTVLPLILSLFI